MNKILYVVTARGGSKGVPRKNIRKIAGLPLIAYKIIAAQRTKHKGRIIVSTDDQEIADVAHRYGGDVPFIRPAELATDTASSIDVVLHALEWAEIHDHVNYDYVCLLEPSSPFATPSDFDMALDMLFKSKSDILLAMKEVGVASCFIWPLDKQGKLSKFYHAVKSLSGLRRQDQQKEYTMNGCMYVAKVEYLKKHKIFHSENAIPYIMPEEKSIEIDSMTDYYFAKYCAENGIIDLSEWK